MFEGSLEGCLVIFQTFFIDKMWSKNEESIDWYLLFSEVRLLRTLNADARANVYVVAEESSIETVIINLQVDKSSMNASIRAPLL